MTVSSKQAAKSSPHSRFIPREEIDAVSAWHFSAVDGSDEHARPEPESGPVAPEVTVEQVLADARQQAWSDGYSQGRDAGAQEAREALEAGTRRAAEEMGVRMGQLLHHMTDQLIASEQKIARQVLELACDIARQVVRQELRTNPASLRPVIGEALELLVEDGLPAAVRMHPDDLAAMKGSLLETLGDNAPELVADPAITPGGCVVQSPSATVDATLEKRWARAVGNLGLNLAWDTQDE
jgi:flagellar assembly protein FliH